MNLEQQTSTPYGYTYPPTASSRGLMQIGLQKPCGVVIH